jgi:hypothetical protein
MEVFAVGFPIFDVIKSNDLRQETLEAIANWEKRQGTDGMNAVDGSVISPSHKSQWLVVHCNTQVY